MCAAAIFGGGEVGIKRFTQVTLPGRYSFEQGHLDLRATAGTHHLMVRALHGKRRWIDARRVEGKGVSSIPRARIEMSGSHIKGALAGGRSYLAIPGPSVVPDHVLNVMHSAS